MKEKEPESVNPGNGTDLSRIAPEIVTPIRSSIAANERGLTLRSFDDMWRVAAALFRSGLAGHGYSSVEAVFTAIEMGAEIGLRPMQSLKGIAVIRGRPSVWGQTQLGICLADPIFDHAGYREWESGAFPNDNYTCHAAVKRKNAPHPVERTFSIEDAKRASLWAKGEGKEGSIWQAYPKRMLRWKALGWALRDCFADVLMGFPTVEDMIEGGDSIEITQVAVEPKALPRPIPMEGGANLKPGTQINLAIQAEADKLKAAAMPPVQTTSDPEQSPGGNGQDAAKSRVAPEIADLRAKIREKIERLDPPAVEAAMSKADMAGMEEVLMSGDVIRLGTLLDALKQEVLRQVQKNKGKAGELFEGGKGPGKAGHAQ